MFCQLCALPHIQKPCLLTDFCFPFLLVPQTTLHIRPLCFMANCLLPHLLSTGWLLTIYSIAWFIMPFLGLDATHRRKVWLLLKELWTLLSALFFYYKGFPCTWFFKVWAGRSRTYEELIFPACPLHSYGLKIYSIVSMPMIFSPMISAENTVIVNMVQRRYSFIASLSAAPKNFSLNCFNIDLSYF